MKYDCCKLALVFSVLLYLPQISNAAPNPIGCRTLVDTDFHETILAGVSNDGLDEPTHLDLIRSAAGVDVYFTERKGKLRCYRAATNSVYTIGSLNVKTEGEMGLLGLALDPNFHENGFIYLYYTPSNELNYTQHISRFTIVNNYLDSSSEHILFIIKTPTLYITGGGMRFDAKEDLWITVGDGKISQGTNYKFNNSSADPHNLLGKILRIHPLANGSYSIPAGNLFPNADTSKTRAEIYAMGVYNPYTINFDSRTEKAAWADYGLDNGSAITDEYNLSDKAGNYGWPYFSGPNTVLKAGEDPLHPILMDSIKGNISLPPAIAATLSVGQNCPIAGPVYRYDDYAASSIKFPPQFDALWFLTDFNTGQLDTLAVLSSGLLSTRGHSFPNFKLKNPIDLLFGPDGALYLVNYAGFLGSTLETSLLRIEYAGDCQRAVSSTRTQLFSPSLFSLIGHKLLVTYKEPYRLMIRDIQGNIKFEENTQTNKEYDLRHITNKLSGVLFVSIQTLKSNNFAKIVF